MGLADLLADFVNKLGKLGSMEAKVIPYVDHGSDLVYDDPLADMAKYCISASRDTKGGQVRCWVSAYAGQIPEPDSSKSPSEVLREVRMDVAEITLELPKGHTITHINSKGKKITGERLSFYTYKDMSVTEYVNVDTLNVKLEDELKLVLSLFEKDYSSR